MKCIHLSDLHLGKRVNEFSMLEDQAYILSQLLTIIQEQAPGCVLIAGDVYDRSIPSVEAVRLLDQTLVQLSQWNIPVFLIAGNHDSPERLAFGAQLLEASNIHISPVYDGHVEPITLYDDLGAVDFYLLPFFKPAQVRHLFPHASIETYHDAMACAIEQLPLRKDRRNVLLAHQFVTGATCSDSEERSIGGTDNVDASLFAPFDYVALGHLHAPQTVGSPHIRYCGTPLKYSFSECHHQKSITVVNLTQTLDVTTIPLTPLRDMMELRGTYLTLTDRQYYQNLDQSAYLHIILTDEEDIPDAMGLLRTIYPNLMRLDYDNKRTRNGQAMPQWESAPSLSPTALFSSLYQQQNGAPLSQEQQTYLNAVVASIWEDTQ